MNISYIVLIVSIALCFFMFFYLKWYIKNRTSASGLLPEYRNEVNRLIVDINAVTDRNLSIVEGKIKELKNVLEEADNRIAVYARELEKSRKGEELYTQLGRGIRAALNTPAEPAAPSALQATALQATAQHAASQYSAPQLSAVRPSIDVIPHLYIHDEQPDVKRTEQPAVQTLPPDHLHIVKSKKQIRTHIDLLANEGLPPEKIASQLGISIAEVDLAMNLRRKNK
jgi:hypothetical protein